MRHVTEQSQGVSQINIDDESELIEPESTLYLRELTEDWANIDLVQPQNFSPGRNIILNNKESDEIRI